jgi:hypothetical protein
MLKFGLGVAAALITVWYVNSRGASGLGSDAATVQHTADKAVSSAQVAASQAHDAYNANK